MDHVPHCGPHTIRVPYLGGEIWDGGDFLGYPQRRGFRARTWPGKQTLQLMQTWLFFGLFTEVMRLAEIDFRREDFIEQDDSGKYLTTKALPSYSQALARYEETQDRASKARRLATIASYLAKINEVVTFIAVLLPHALDKPFYQSTGGPIMLSIGVTGTWLAKSCGAIYRDVLGGSAVHLQEYNHASGSFLEDKMLAEGWCPSLTERLSILGNKELQYVGYTHGCPDTARQDHSACSATLCSRSQIDDATYQVRHTSQGCTCEILDIDRAKMEDIIRSGETPVCRLVAVEAQAVRTAPEIDIRKGMDNLEIGSASESEERAGFRLEVECASSERPYLAISHVWADGLGNPTRNALPLCELIQLQCRVSGGFVENQSQATQPRFDATWSKWFWMDTLCVPVHAEAKPLRKQVIAQMRHIYTAAEGALVLDRGLLHRRGPNDNVQWMIRILLSSWYSRLWTMQESVLAKKVMIVFGSHDDDRQNTFLILDDWAKGFGPMTRDERALRGSTVASTCLALYQSLRKPVLLAMNNPTAHILRAVPHRAVSKREDETICISTLLGLDLEKLLDPQPSGNGHSVDTELADQRMITLLQMMGTIPFSCVFAPGARFAQPGFRWALKSFLRQTGSQPVFHDSPTAMVLGNGLLCSTGGILLAADVGHCSNFMVYEDRSDVPIAVANLPRQQKYQDAIAASADKTEERRLAVILAADINLGGPAIVAEILEAEAPTHATEGGGDNDVKRVRFLKLVGVTRLALDPEFARAMSAKAEYITGGTLLDAQQKWLIT